MRKLVVLLMILMIPFFTVSGISITGFGAYNINLDDLGAVQNLEEGGIGGGGRLGFGISLLTVGLMVEYLPIYSYSIAVPAVPALNQVAHVDKCSKTTIPVMAFVRSGLGPLPFYVIGGAGMYFSTINVLSQSDFGVAIGGGFEFDMLPIITLEAGVLYHMIMADPVIMVDPDSMKMLTITAGITLSI